ncbi:MAG TPA: DUF6249 domain-containing protein [Vicinamibacterales bacterium]|nr:DUF6249 domain-containing protein [Vicinamibacterales bacterium]
MTEGEAIVLTMALIIFGALAVLWMAMYSRRQFREMEHRERLAMIERGLVPPPERDPESFERQSGVSRPPASTASTRSRSVGIIMIGLGLAFMVLVSFAAGAPEAGVGIGGAFAVLGAAFVFNAALMARQNPYDSFSRGYQLRRTPEPPHPTPIEPPTPPGTPPA